MAQLLQELSKPRQQDPNRRPVFLFLGGGMAAGETHQVLQQDFGVSVSC